MLFNSIDFPFFLITILFLHFIIPHRFRWILLLMGSYFFYMCWRINYAFLMLGSTVIDYFCALGIFHSQSKNYRKTLLGVSLCANLGLLFTFKYYNFFAREISEFFQNTGYSFSLTELKFLLPLGISFYTFQTLSYVLDVYQKKIEPEKHFGYFALYVSFFPQLVAGPIERASRLLPQFRTNHIFQESRAIEGLRRILWGMFKKVVIADHLAFYVNLVFANPENYHGPHFWIGTYFFAFQIYCDFSGYSDIAIGTAKILGYDLMENFKSPYFSKSIPEFWSRWHISLSTWFRDYLYVPLGGNRVGPGRWYFNLVFVFLVSGMWHGANWTFLAWGGLHGIYQIGTVSLRKFSIKPPTKKFFLFLLMVLNFHLVCLAWIFFRAETISEAFYIVTHLFSGMGTLRTIALTFGNTNLLLGILLILFLLGIEGIQEVSTRKFSSLPKWLRWSYYYLLLFGILYLGVFETHEFIYFRF